MTFADVGATGDIMGFPSGAMVVLFPHPKTGIWVEKVLCLNYPGFSYTSPCPQTWSDFLLEWRFGSPAVFQ